MYMHVCIVCIHSVYSCIVCQINVRVYIPGLPHKVAAEISKIGRYRGGELLRCMDGRANPLCLLEWLQWLQRSPHPQLLDVVWCGAVVAVVVV